MKWNAQLNVQCLETFSPMFGKIISGISNAWNESIFASLRLRGHLKTHLAGTVFDRKGAKTQRRRGGAFLRNSLFIIPCSAVLLLLFGFAETKAEEARSPNVLLIISDDQGYSDFGFMGNPVLRTPRIDQLAESGAVFRNYVTGAACSPSRAMIFTGREHLLTGVWSVPPCQNLHTDETMMPAFFKAAGYGTFYLGKRDCVSQHHTLPWFAGWDNWLCVGGYQHFDAGMDTKPPGEKPTARGEPARAERRVAVRRHRGGWRPSRGKGRERAVRDARRRRRGEPFHALRRVGKGHGDVREERDRAGSRDVAGRARGGGLDARVARRSEEYVPR